MSTVLLTSGMTEAVWMRWIEGTGWELATRSWAMLSLCDDSNIQIITYYHQKCDDNMGYMVIII